MSDWYHKLPSVHAWAASSARLADASAATAASPARAAASRASRTASAAPASPNARTIAPRHAAASLPVKVHPFRQSPFLCPSRRLVRALRIPNPTHRQPYTASPTPPASRHGPASRATLTPLVIAPRLLKPGRCARVRAYALTLAGNGRTRGVAARRSRTLAHPRGCQAAFLCQALTPQRLTPEELTTP